MTNPDQTDAVVEAARDLAIAAEGVLDAWEGGDLTDAVRGLAVELAQRRAALPAATADHDGAATS
jgi:hypothetical protein